MKYILFLLIIPVLIFSQDIEPSSLTFTVDGQVQTMEEEDYSWDEFIIGWQWGGPYKLTEALGMNTHHHHLASNFNYNLIARGTPTFTADEHYVIGDPYSFPAQAAAVIFEPTLKKTEAWKFETRYGDPSNPVFGFKDIHHSASIINDLSNENFSRLILFESSTYSGTILKNAMPGEELISHAQGTLDKLWDDYFDIEEIQILKRALKERYIESSGLQWNLSVNLRRLNPTSASSSTNTVLEIRLPYVKGDGSKGYINFERHPNKNKLEEYNFNDDRGNGFETSVTYSFPNSSTLTITEDMLPTLGNNIGSIQQNEDITISAYFYTDGEIPFENKNPHLKDLYDDNITAEEIKYLGVEVSYYGHEDIAIDWIRIADITATELFQGKYDIGAGVDDGNLAWDIQHDVEENVFSSTHSINKLNRTKIFRLHASGSDDGPKPWYWATARYLNKLFGQGINWSQPAEHFDHFEYYVNPNFYWVNIYGVGDMSSPQYRFQNDAYMRVSGTSTSYMLDQYPRVGYNLGKSRNGMVHYNDPNRPNYNKNDSLISGWETQINHLGWRDSVENLYPLYVEPGDEDILAKLESTEPVKVFAWAADYGNPDFNNYYLMDPDEYYFKSFGKTTPSMQTKIEYTWFNHLYNSKVYYHNEPWIAQIFTSHWWFVYKENSTYNNRIQTRFEKVIFGTALELFQDNAIIMGAKGLQYDSDGAMGISGTFTNSSNASTYTYKHSNSEGQKGVLEDLTNSSSYLAQIDNYDFHPSTGGNLHNSEGFHPGLGLYEDSEFIFGQIKNGTQLVERVKTRDYLDEFSLEEIVDTEERGPDFIGPGGDLFNMYEYLPDVEDNLGVPADRFYLGLRSIRKQMKKKHDWIALNQDTLLKLNLLQWIGEGYRRHTTKNTKRFGDTEPLRRYIKTDDIRTRRIFRPNEDLNHSYNEEYEHRDSAFFDITFHEHDNFKFTWYTNNDFFIGLQNRRVDPLIFVEDESSTPIDDQRGELQFFSMAEFTDAMSNTITTTPDLYGQQHDHDWWQDQWWKRLGIREISFPFDVKPWGKGCYLHVEELGSSSLTDLSWQYEDDYYDNVSRDYSYNGTFSGTFLPGEGKMLKVSFESFLPEDEEEDGCSTCDIFDDFSSSSFEVRKKDGELEECCYEIIFHTDSDCQLDHLPYKLLTSEGNQLAYTASNSFQAQTFELPISSNFDGYIETSETFNIDGSGTYTNGTNVSSSYNLGEVCNYGTSETFDFQILIGSDEYTADKGYQFFGCDRAFNYNLDCSSTQNETELCCESIDGSEFSSTYRAGSADAGGLYCNDIYLDELIDVDCIYGLAVQSGGAKKVDLEDEPYFENNSGKILTICTHVDCITDGGENLTEHTVPLELLGKNGEVICVVDISFWNYCVSVYDGNIDISFTGPTGPGDDPFAGSAPPSDFNSVENKITKNNYTLNPNPNNGEFELNFDLELNKELIISVHNSIGEVIYQIDNKAYSKGRNTERITLQNLNNGVYYLNIQELDEVTTIPFVIRK